MELINDWRQIPPPARELFNLDDIVNQTNGFLNIAVRSGLVSFSLHVYQPPGERTCRWHFYVHLNESLQFCDTNGEYASIRGLAFWMKPVENGLAGELAIRFVVGHRPFMHPIANFEFPLKNANRPYDQNLTFIDLINVLQGSAQGLPYAEKGNLLRFQFWAGQEGWNGHRDALTQWMVRLNKTQIVGWRYFDKTTEDAYFEGDLEALEEPSFDRVIGVTFTTDGVEDKAGFINVVITPKRIRRGVFLSGRVLRVTSQNGATLPYEGPAAWPSSPSLPALPNASGD
ncbi:hypothetical protein NW762_003303 [Fusarium torreyae]|uniref:Uncharacterized protein n=1 Tax=Fusarium torreyae TaxID=1237075 RepID=A0A9W8VIY7_9HYPO|nr:hypothetical protein NW762_003303 [Fusarium torreyae]